MKNLLGETVKVKKKKEEKPLKVYYIKDEEYAYFFIARTPGGARYGYANEMGVCFEETFYSGFTIQRVPRLDKYIKSEHDGANINPWEDEYWTRAIYAEVGSFVNPYCEIGNNKTLTLEMMLKRECFHEGKESCSWDDESVYIELPPKSQDNK